MDMILVLRELFPEGNADYSNISSHMTYKQVRNVWKQSNPTLPSQQNFDDAWQTIQDGWEEVVKEQIHKRRLLHLVEEEPSDELVPEGYGITYVHEGLTTKSFGVKYRDHEGNLYKGLFPLTKV